MGFGLFVCFFFFVQETGKMTWVRVTIYWRRFRFNSLHRLTYYTYVKSCHFINFISLSSFWNVIFAIFMWPIYDQTYLYYSIPVCICEVNKKKNVCGSSKSFSFSKKIASCVFFFFVLCVDFAMSFVHNMSFHFNGRENPNEFGLIVTKRTHTHTNMPKKK